MTSDPHPNDLKDCTCPFWWFPEDRRERLRQMPDSVFMAHHHDCAKSRPDVPRPARMDAPDGPICGCGRPSTHESGWCGIPCVFSPGVS